MRDSEVRTASFITSEDPLRFLYFFVIFAQSLTVPARVACEFHNWRGLQRRKAASLDANDVAQRARIVPGGVTL